MAGYSDTRQLIIDTLMGRPAGTEIQPEDHQAFALALNDYIRSVELSSGSTLTGIAESNTVPIEPDNSRVAYIASVPQNTVKTFTYFGKENNEPITITTTDSSVFVILLWNTQYWEYQSIPVTVLENKSFVGYFECSSLSTDANKTISSEINQLTTNLRILVKMNNINTQDNATLQIGLTNSKPLYYNGLRVSSTNSWAQNEVLDIYFDGSNYVATTYSGAINLKTLDTQLSQLEQRVSGSFLKTNSLQPLDNIEDITNFISEGYYKPDGSFQSSNSFKYQKVTIDSSKAYYIKNNNGEYTISTLVLFDINDNVLYANGADIAIDGIFVFPDFVKAFGTCGQIARDIIIQEGNIPSKVGKEQLKSELIQELNNPVVELTSFSNLLSLSFDSESDITNPINGFYDSNGQYHTSSHDWYCQKINIDHSKAYRISRSGLTYGFSGIMYLDSNDNILYRGEENEGIINRIYVFPKNVSKIILNWYTAGNCTIKSSLYNSLDVPISESNTIFFDITRNVFIPKSQSDGTFVNGDFYLRYHDFTTFFRIPVEGDKTYYLTLSDNNPLSARIRSLDADGNYITDSYSPNIGTTNPYSTPTNAKFVDISLSKASLTGELQLELNQITSYIYPFLLKQKYIPSIPISDNSISTSKLQDGSVSLQKTDFATLGKNLYNKDDITVGILYQGTILPRYETWRVSNKIPVEYLMTYRVSVEGSPNNIPATRIAMYGADDSIISYNDSFVNSTITINDESVTYIRISFNTESVNFDIAKIQVEKGNDVTPFQPYGYFIKENVLPKSVEINLTDGVEISLPDKIYAVVGDTLQLFYNGMIKAVNPFIFNILTNCSKGAMYPRYWQYTPTAGDVGTTIFTLKVLDNNRNVIARKSTTIVTVAEPISPSSDIHIACFGDSLTANGYWPHECDRRLTGIDGTPAGKELMNITFVGSKVKDGTHYHGGSGWSWRNYTTEGGLAFRFTLSGTPQLGMGAVYSNNGHQYTIIEIINNTILCSPVSDGTPVTSANASHYAPSASGTLTRVSGTGDSSLSFTNSEQDSSNPLWDYQNNKMSFIPYAQNFCDGQIDVVYVFLTWNNPMTNWKSDFSDMLTQATIFADTLHSEFPNAKLKLMAVQFPSIKRGMPDYGASGDTHSDVYGMLVSAFNMNKAYQDWCNQDGYSSWCEFVNVASQFDSDYCMNIVEKNVNTRSTIKEYVVHNGVHPMVPDGYYQIADVVYRNIVANFCQI